MSYLVKHTPIDFRDLYPSYNSGVPFSVAMACDVFGYTQVLCIFTSPIVGLLLDRSRGHLNGERHVYSPIE